MTTAAKTKPAQTKQTTCAKYVKASTGAKVRCDLKLAGVTCPNKREHVLDYPTGYCNAGFHEGEVARTASGAPAKICAAWKYCPCSCHALFDTMFSESSMDRILVDKSGYSPPKSPYYMPSEEERALASISSNAPVASAPVVLESAAPGTLPATVARTFVPTASGRTARGELETWVGKATDEWCVEEYSFNCTPAWISETIAKAQGVKPPSVGAIDAVLNRWVKIGFAIVEKKPTRFTGYTDTGIQMGLEALKFRAKQNSKVDTVKRRVLG